LTQFAFVVPEAFEVVEFFNITVRPRWMVVKIDDVVKMEKRVYRGELTFEDLKTYLGLFQSKTQADRRESQDIGKHKIKDKLFKDGSKVTMMDFDFNLPEANLDYPEDVVIVNVSDQLTMNYPNLLIFQKFYG
jgi:hypothetical protein